MTIATAPELVLFDGDNSHCYLDLSTCKDIATHGMAMGVPGFIYNHNLWEWFNENSDEIESELNCFVEDAYGDEYRNYIHWLSSTQDIADHLSLKQAAVWAYVEIKCYNFVLEHCPDF